MASLNNYSAKEFADAQEKYVNDGKKKWSVLWKPHERSLLVATWKRAYEYTIRQCEEGMKSYVSEAIRKYEANSHYSNWQLSAYKDMKSLEKSKDAKVLTNQLMWITPHVSQLLPLGLTLFEGRSNRSLEREREEGAIGEIRVGEVFHRRRATSTSLAQWKALRYGRALQSMDQSSAENMFVHEIVSSGVRAIDVDVAHNIISGPLIATGLFEIVLQPFLHMHIADVFVVNFDAEIYSNDGRGWKNHLAPSHKNVRIIHTHVYSESGSCPKCRPKRAAATGTAFDMSDDSSQVQTRDTLAYLIQNHMN